MRIDTKHYRKHVLIASINYRKLASLIEIPIAIPLR